MVQVGITLRIDATAAAGAPVLWSWLGCLGGGVLSCIQFVAQDGCHGCCSALPSGCFFREAIPPSAPNVCSGPLPACLRRCAYELASSRASRHGGRSDARPLMEFERAARSLVSRATLGQLALISKRCAGTAPLTHLNLPQNLPVYTQCVVCTVQKTN